MAKRGSKQATAGQAVAMPFSGGIDSQLRVAIQDSGLSRYAIAQQSGISQSVLSRFVNGERGLTVETAERLAVALGWQMALVGLRPSAFHMLADMFDDGPEPPVLPRTLVLDAIKGLAETSSLPPYVAIADVRARLSDRSWMIQAEWQRKEFPSRAAVDESIRVLRKCGAVSLSVAECRHEMTAAERDAGLMDEGKLYTLVHVTGGMASACASLEKW
jgi:transcriptional regulator with XRE-family HTH domain